MWVSLSRGFRTRCSCHPERSEGSAPGLVIPSVARDLHLALVIPSVAICTYFVGDKSSHPGFIDVISAIRFALVQDLTCFSRVIAATTSLVVS